MPGNDYVNYLAVLVDGPVHVAPAAVDLDVRIAGHRRYAVAGGPSRSAQGESLDQPEQLDVIHLNAALGEDLHQVPVGQSVSQEPPGRPAGSPQEGKGTQRTPKEPARAAWHGDYTSSSHSHRPRPIRQRNSAAWFSNWLPSNVTLLSYVLFCWQVGARRSFPSPSRDVRHAFAEEASGVVD